MPSYPRQFLLSRSPSNVSMGWRTHTAGGFQLTTDPALPVTMLHGPDGALWGWILGNPVTAMGDLPGDTVKLPAPDDNAFESALYDLGGAWTCIVAEGGHPRICMDVCGSRGVVYCPELQQAASSTGLFSGIEFDDSLRRHMDIPRQDRWYPFGLTPRRGCRRLLPNHMLDLRTWKSERIWPRKSITAVSVEAAVRGIVDQTTRVVHAFAPLRPYVSITAGRDSRVLLACARSALGEISSFTVATRRNKLDARIGSHIAQRFGFEHTTLTRRKATRNDLDAWQRRVDHCVAGSSWKNVSTLAALDGSRPYLLGLAGELVRAYYWRSRDQGRVRLTPADLASRLELPDIPEVERAAAAWLSNLPEMSPNHILDLLYLEQRVGCWAAPQNEGHASSAFRIFPFAHRRTVECMLGLPDWYKLEGRLADDVIRPVWPELLDVPFNKPLSAMGRIAEKMQDRVRRTRRQIALRINHSPSS